MKILHINCNYIGTALHRIMIQHLNNTDFSITVFVPIWDKKQKEEFKPQNGEIVSVCFKKWDRLFFFLKQKKIINSLKQDIKDIKQYNLIHAFTLMTDGNTAYQLSKEYGIPYVVAVRDTDINAFFRIKPYLRPLGIRIMLNASAVIFLSTAYKNLVLEKYVPLKHRITIEKKTYVIPNGIDDYWFENIYRKRNIETTIQRIKEKEISIVCVGKINKRKNIPTVQKALHILRKRGWTVDFNVIGKIEEPSEHNTVVKDPYTNYHPPVNKSELIKFYRMSDLFVLASHTETFGLVYAEAMSQGLPVIYTRGQGFDGQFPEGEVGYGVNDKDPVEIANTIEKLCKCYFDVANHTIKSVFKFKWDDICNQYRQIYKRINNNSWK